MNMQYLHSVQIKSTTYRYLHIFSNGVTIWRFARNLLRLSFNITALTWLTTPKLCEYTTLWNKTMQNCGWTLYFSQTVKCSNAGIRPTWSWSFSTRCTWEPMHDVCGWLLPWWQAKKLMVQTLQMSFFRLPRIHCWYKHLLHFYAIKFVL